MLTRRYLVAGIVVLAAVVAVVVALTQLLPGGTAALPKIQPAQVTGPKEPPAPPRGALVLSREAGSFGVAVELESRVATAIVLSPHGGGATGLTVSLRLRPGGSVRTTPCGAGCYRAGISRRPRTVRVVVAGAPPADFTIPGSTPPAAGILVRSARAMRALQTLVYREHLASSPTNAIVTIWKLEAPDRLAYTIDNGVAGVVVGPRRWDKSSPKARWIESSQFRLHVMQPAWGSEAVNAHLLGSGAVHGRPAWHVSFANPQIPAFFDAWIDEANARTLELDMTASAHFMHHDYLRFNAPLAIRPPA